MSPFSATRISRPLLLLLLTISTVAACAPKPQLQEQSLKRDVRLICRGEISGVFAGHALVTPQALAFDPAGNLYIVDRGNDRLLKLDKQHHLIAVNGGYGSELSTLNRPTDIATDDGVHFFVLDEGNRRLVKTDYNLVFVDAVGFDDNPDLQSVGIPAGIAVTADGRLLLSDPDRLRVLMLDTDYSVEQELFPPGGFAFNTALATDEQGKIWVADRKQNVISLFDRFGHSLSQIALAAKEEITDFALIAELVVATYQDSDRLVVLDRNGEVLAATGDSQDEMPALNMPSGVAVRSDGVIFVCDAGNNRILYYELARK